MLGLHGNTAHLDLLAIHFQLADISAHLMEVEYEVELTDIPKVFIQNLYKMVNDFQGYELIICLINAHDKEEAGISFVDYL